MVLGLRSKSRRSVPVQVHYLIHVQEVKPWPPSESLKSARSLFFQWENGDQNSGSLTCGVRDGRIGIGESFRLPITLCREASRKGGRTHDRFQKNSLDFYLYEPQKAEAVKGQLLGTAAINLADFGVIREAITVRTQLNCKKSFKNSAQPSLYVYIQPLDSETSSSSPKDSLSKEVSLDKSKSYSELTNDGNDGDAEIAAFTDDDDDDDLSSNSSQHITSSAFRTGGFSRQRSDQQMVESKLQSKSESDKDSTERIIVGILEDEKKKELQENGQEKQTLEVETCRVEDKLVGKISKDAALKQVKFRNDTLLFSGEYSLGVQSSVHKTNEIKHIKSIQFPFNSDNSSATFKTSQLLEHKENINITEAASAVSYAANESKATKNEFSNEKFELESKVKMLEEELQEAAAVEVALYSVVAEHGSSATKTLAPARRLSRFYLHACRARSPANRASAARTAASGLVLVAKACGNDVPRLTFWLSNSILLRAIISQAIEKLQLSAGRNTCSNEESSLHVEQKNNAVECFEDWEDPQTLIVALENIEAWIFYRIIESVWWQTLTPHMQPAIAKSSGSAKTHGRRCGLGDQEQGNFSIDLWKKAFKDSCERLCPLRAGGLQCGCLPVLARLVMEQLVDRLDVAMFNAILRESADEMPTDPISDPISDSKVLPVPVGKSSFGSGAQLKNALGNWSRWLTDLFGIDDGDPCEDGIEIDDYKKLECKTSFKAFHLLNALSDLMMLPFEMLADRSIRTEVCPKFSGSLIKRVLNNFVPDEFCPDPIPEAVFKALDSEDILEDEGNPITSFPCTAASTVYQPPPAASLTSIIGEVGSQAIMSGSLVLRKSHTSDDELDELDSLTTSIDIENFRVSPTSANPNIMLKKGRGRKVVRYQLLQEVWRDCE